MPRGRRIALAASLLLIGTVGLAVAYGIEVWMRKANPLMDVPSAEFLKTINATTVRQGDILRVDLFIGWHGHVLPEFTRHVKVVDPYPEDCFILVAGSNTYEYNGAGPGPSFTYTLKVIGGQGKAVQLPQPKFYLDDVEIPLSGESPSLQIS